jgi:hypothetical protein
VRIDEVLNDINVKGYVTKRLLKDWRTDPFMPINAKSPGEMFHSDRKMFWKTVTKLVDHIESSNLPLDDAYEDYFDQLAAGIGSPEDFK